MHLSARVVVAERSDSFWWRFCDRWGSRLCKTTPLPGGTLPAQTQLLFGSLRFIKGCRKREIINRHETEPDQRHRRKQYVSHPHQGTCFHLRLVWCYARPDEYSGNSSFSSMQNVSLERLNFAASLSRTTSIAATVDSDFFFSHTRHEHKTKNTLNPLYYCSQPLHLSVKKKNKRVAQISSTTCVKNNLFPFLCSHKMNIKA